MQSNVACITQKKIKIEKSVIQIMALEGSHEEHIIVNGTLLSGIQNISFSQNVQEQVVSYLGNDFGGTTINGPTVVTAAIDKILLNQDFITGLTGLNNISGQFEYGDNLANFSQTVLNGYAVSASIGEIPQISFDLSIYGSISGAETSIKSTALNDNTFETFSQEKLIVTYDKGVTNPIQSFNFSCFSKLFGRSQSENERTFDPRAARLDRRCHCRGQAARSPCSTSSCERGFGFGLRAQFM